MAALLISAISVAVFYEPHLKWRIAITIIRLSVRFNAGIGFAWLRENANPRVWGVPLKKQEAHSWDCFSYRIVLCYKHKVSGVDL